MEPRSKAPTVRAFGRRFALAAAAWLAALLPSAIQGDAGAYWTTPVPEQGPAPANLPWPASSLDAADCGLCHPRQYEEWRDSWHAGATSPGLLGQIEAFDDETRTLCLDCHAPRAEQQAELVASSPPADVGGVDCAGCHVRSHRRFGPRDRPSTPHGPVRAEPLFRSSQFCAPCHQFTPEGVAINGKLLENTLEEWRGSRHAADGVTCQGCHMPDGSHRFLGIHDPGMLRRGLALHVTRTPEAIVATLVNRGAGHALPTYITPRIRLLASNASRTRSTELVIQRSMDWQPRGGWRELADTRLLPDEARHLRLAISPDDTARVRLVVEPDADYHDRVYPYLIENLRDEVGEAGLARLRDARAAAAASPYTAYDIRCGVARRTSYRCEPQGPVAPSRARRMPTGALHW